MRLKKYRVKTLYISGRYKQFKCHDIVTENDFHPGVAEAFRKKQYLEDLDEPKEKIDIDSLPEVSNPPKIAFISAMWKRPQIFELFAKNLNHIKKTFKDKAEIEVFISGSERDVSKNLCEKYKFNYTEVPNRPLGGKMNAALLLSKKFNADYYIFLGSDDIFCETLMDKYLECINNRFEFVQLLDCYFFDVNNHKSLYWGGYIDFRTGKGVGAGRMLSKNIIHHFYFNLWANNVNKSLDYTFDMKIRGIRCKTKKIKLSDINAVMLDLKNEDSITTFRQFPNSNFISKSLFRKKFKHLKIFD